MPESFLPREVYLLRAGKFSVIYTLDVQITGIGQPQGIAPTGAIVGATLVVAPF